MSSSCELKSTSESLCPRLLLDSMGSIPPIGRQTCSQRTKDLSDVPKRGGLTTLTDKETYTSFHWGRPGSMPSPRILGLNSRVPFGWEAARTPKSYDGGADGLLRHRKSCATVILQCKHTQGDHGVCGPEAIEDLLRARRHCSETGRQFFVANAVVFRGMLSRSLKDIRLN